MSLNSIGALSISPESAGKLQDTSERVRLLRKVIREQLIAIRVSHDEKLARPSKSFSAR